MKDNKSTPISPNADRMGRFIGQLRDHEGITLGQLARGLCSTSHLGRIENGEREVGKQLTDALFQRLGKPAELFERILDWGEFQRWTRRQEIISSLHRGEVEHVRTLLGKYLTRKPKVLDRQFAAVIEINCSHLSGAAADELLPMVRDALLLTQPKFQTTPIQKLLLSQNEGRLLFAYLQLREKLEGFASVEEDYSALLSYFKHPRYESRERVYLVPYVACRVIECEYLRGNYQTALDICEDALAELTCEERLYAYDKLLKWKIKLFDAMGNPDRTPEKLLEQLTLILAYIPQQTELLIPCDEQGHVYCLNQVIRDRRRLLGISQEKLAEGICDPRTLSRIEKHGGNLHRKNRKLLLQRVNMSGERYDYEVITDHYEDYLLRSELDRALSAGMTDKVETLLVELRQRIPDIPTNSQYIVKTECKLKLPCAKDSSDGTSPTELAKRLEDALTLTLPLDFEDISIWTVSILSINELMMLQSVALYYEKLGKPEKGISILTYIKQCLENTGTDASYYENLYSQVVLNLASRLGNLGQYKESNELLVSCMQLSLDKRNTRRIAKYLYGIAWNLKKQFSDLSKAEPDLNEQKIVSILKQAYVAAVFSGDTAGQQHIKNRCLKLCGVALEL